MKHLLAIGILCASALAVAPGHSEEAAAVPDFSGTWMRNGNVFDFPPAPPGVSPGPLVNISGDRLLPIGDYKNPVLQPWAAAAIKKFGDRELAGEIPLDAHTSCYPMGVPYVLQVRDSMQLLQTPDAITIIYMQNNQRRLVRLNAQHPAHPTPSWFGDSIGHYDGDTLIVDTIGIAVHETSAIDRFGTPHTEAMHVVERYRVTDDRKTMRVDVTVDDPGTFTMPWHTLVPYGRGTGAPFEYICAENSRNGPSGDIPVPLAAKADF